ncbi:hypothetical protein BCR39DRAFT_82324 [Naematelia encephala]|uniref:Membrane anchor Opy2 N-terminal domain-containing protein n=1 Tax=Naematelia encephala TaxID=71784 RepID=A0A1Y2BAW2_9TREE|nr:hypothetical protein BCR39DRAFT_82324 [Naematelia encephala]
MNTLHAKALFGRDDCVQCDDGTPSCNCASGEQCVLSARTCSQCASIQCIKPSSSSGGGVNPGVIAGPIVAVLVIASLALFWWLRRKKRRDLSRLESLAQRAKKAEVPGFQLSNPSSPQPPSAYSGSLRSYRASQLPQPPPSASSRRSALPQAPVNAEYYDENGAMIRVYGGKSGRIDLGREGDPFSDRQSVSTAGSSQSTHIIPIQWMPPSKSDETLSKALHGGAPSVARTDAARKLNQARENLFRPPRPARSPDLDLRLAPPQSPPDTSPHIRDSYVSGNSGAPSFLSGMTDLHDAPKIITSKQVQIGRLQQAEFVQFGRHLPTHPEPSTAGLSSPTFGTGTLPSDNGGSGSGVRNLTPSNHASVDMGGTGAEPLSAGASDLRFSMGSLADDGARNSWSTTGTSRILARPGSAPRAPFVSSAEPRESMLSTRSYADSFLGGFPMIPPGAPGSSAPPLPTSNLPQSTSVATLSHAAMPISSSTATVGMDSPSRSSQPPPSFRAPRVSNANTNTNENHTSAPSRPITATSVADSFLGSFPFVPPNVDDLAVLPSAAIPDSAAAGGAGGGGSRGRNYLGMSTTSEGLGGFEFNFDDAPPPPMPRRRG